MFVQNCERSSAQYDGYGLFSFWEGRLIVTEKTRVCCRSPLTKMVHVPGPHRLYVDIVCSSNFFVLPKSPVIPIRHQLRDLAKIVSDSPKIILQLSRIVLVHTPDRGPIDFPPHAPAHKVCVLCEQTRQSAPRRHRRHHRHGSRTR